jgi:hypothetical protein
MSCCDEYELSAAEAAQYWGYSEEERRDYCAEAYSIAAGGTRLRVERGHLTALCAEINWLESRIAWLERQNRRLRATHPAFAAVQKKEG